MPAHRIDEIALGQGVEDPVGFNLGVLQIPQGRPERRPGAGHLDEAGPGRKISGQPAQEEVNQLLKKKLRTNPLRSPNPGFFQQPNGELMKSQDMDIEQRQAMLDAEEPFEAAAQGAGRNDDGKRRQWIGCPELLNFTDESLFEVGMEGTGDDPKHRGLTMNTE